MPKFSEMFPSKFLKASDLKGRQVKSIISDVRKELVGDDERHVLYFEGKDKGLVLNKTNGSTIANTLGDDTEDWRGGEIIMFETPVVFEGKTLPSIRCRVAPRKQETPKEADIEEDIPF